MVPVAMGHRGMTSLNVPKSTLQEPPFQEDPAVPRLGKLGPVYNEDVRLRLWSSARLVSRLDDEGV